jgi:hypothetical protein
MAKIDNADKMAETLRRAETMADDVSTMLSEVHRLTDDDAFAERVLAIRSRITQAAMALRVASVEVTEV